MERNCGPSSSKLASTTKSHERGIDDPNQFELGLFVSINKNPSTIYGNTNTNTLSGSSNGLSDTCEVNLTHALLFATDMEMKEISIIIILVYEKSLPVKERPEDSIYVKVKVNQKYYFGRVMMLSKNLEHLKASVKIALNKIREFSGYQILGKKLLIANKKPHDVSQLDTSDDREIFLRKHLNDNEDEITEEFDIDELEDNSQVVNKGEQRNMTNKHSVIENGNLRSISIMDGLDQETETRNILHDKNEAQKTDFGDANLSLSDDELERESQLKAKKRKIYDFTDESKDYSKILREQRKKLAEESKKNIERLIENLEKLEPTLPINERSTIFLKLMFQLVKEKYNYTKEEKEFAERIPLRRKITIEEIRSKDQIKLGNKVTLPLKKYYRAIEGKEPRLVVSRIMRFCFDSSLLVGSRINDNHDDSNFLFRLGSKSLSGKQRVIDGHDILDIIIEHAHKRKNENSMSVKSRNACWNEIRKAISDFNRRANEKKTQNEQIVNDYTSKHGMNQLKESQSSTSELPDSVRLM